MKNETAVVEELKTYSKSELIQEIVLLNDEVNGIWKTKERYKNMLKIQAVLVGNAENLKGRVERLQARLDYYEQPTDISEVDLNG